MKDIKGITKVNVLAKYFDELSVKPMPMALPQGKWLFMKRKNEQFELRGHKQDRIVGESATP